MARNRTTVDREEKRAEILDAATDLFLTNGYEATSMTALAKAAGIATNTIYWYFDDKDALFIEVAERTFGESLAEYGAQVLPTLVDRLLWLVTVFERLNGLTATVHARARVSPSISTWHDDFHATADRWLIHQARQHLAAGANHTPPPTDEQLAAIPRIWSYAIEGMVVHQLSDRERRQVCETLVRQLDAL
ncbi:MAG: TetR/AcrR family transcriptional regulator [Solirubrobacteraceae bacterium]|nr:TetR/AcrR family transcriptional regulator [Solirubrobacteraceae bacterium]